MSLDFAWSLGWRVVATAGLLSACLGCLFPVLTFGLWLSSRIEGATPGFLRRWAGTVLAIFIGLLAELPLLGGTILGLGLVWQGLR